MMSVAPRPAAGGGGGGGVGGVGLEKRPQKSGCEVLRLLMDRIALQLLDGVSLQVSDFFQLCIWLSKAIDSAVANNEQPTKVHDLPQLVKKVCDRKNEACLQPAIMVLMLSVKNACRNGWFEAADADALLALSYEISSHFCNTGNITMDTNNVLSLVAEVTPRFFPQLSVRHLVISVEAKAGYTILVTDFYIPKNLLTIPQERIRLFVSQVDNLETSSCIVSPPQVNFLINGRGVEGRYNESMVQPQEPGPQLPTDITGMLKLGTNLLQAIGNFTGKYIIAVSVMIATSIPDATTLKEYVQPAVSTLPTDEEIIEGPSLISLNCPISFQRIRTPVKGQSCKHIQCFDYENFMEINSRKPYWRCPHCNQSVSCTDLRVDQNMLKVLTAVGHDVSDVLIFPDGSWKIHIEKDVHLDHLPTHSPHRSGEGFEHGDSSIFSANSNSVVDLSAETENLVDNVEDLENLRQNTSKCVHANSSEIIDRKPSQEILDSLVHTVSHSGALFVNPSAESSQRHDGQILRDIWARGSSNYVSHGSAVLPVSLGISTVPLSESTYSSGNLVSMTTDAVAVALRRESEDTQIIYQPSSTHLQNIPPSRLAVAAEDFQMQHSWLVGNAVTESGRPAIPRNVARAPLAVQALPAQTQMQSALSRARKSAVFANSVANAPGASSPIPFMTSNPVIGNIDTECQQLLRQQTNLLGRPDLSSTSLHMHSNSQERQHHPNQAFQPVGLPAMSQVGLRNRLDRQRIGVRLTQASSLRDQQSMQYQPSVNLKVPQTNMHSESIVRQVASYPSFPVHQAVQPTVGLAATAGPSLVMRPAANQQNLLAQNSTPNVTPSHMTRPSLSSGLSIPRSADTSRLTMDQRWNSPVLSVSTSEPAPDMSSELNWRPIRRMRGSININNINLAGGQINPGLVSQYLTQPHAQGQPRPSTSPAQLPILIANNLIAHRSQSDTHTGNAVE